MDSIETSQGLTYSPIPPMKGMICLEEMARAIDASPGWILMEVRAGRIPAMRADDQLWFWPEIVHAIVALLRRPIEVIDCTSEPMPKLRFCDELDEDEQDPPQADATMRRPD